MPDTALLVWLVLLIYYPILIHRNHRVSSYRLDLIHRIGSAARQDFADFGISDPSRRFDLFEAGPSHREMVFKFWKPLSSFFDEDELLGPRRS